MIAITTRSTARRSGFTLVELMVAAAVSVIIMAILATVFQSGIDVMRDMRSIGTLQDQLRAATEMIRHDLQSDHFLPRDTHNGAGQLISGAKLSDQRLTDPGWQPPLGGFFRIESNVAWTTDSQPDGDGLNFTRTQTPNFLLHFTSILPGDKPQNMFSATINPPISTTPVTMNSPAAEIQYFVDTTSSRLIRRQRLVAKTELDKNSLTPADPLVIAAPSSTTAFNLTEVANPANRMTSRQVLVGGGRDGDDVLLSNVLMFEVKVNWDNAAGMNGGRPFTPAATDAPFDYLNGAGGPNFVFDTGDGLTAGTAQPPTPNPPGGSPPDARIRVKALQIRIRIFDPQLRTTRQVTIVQDL